MNEKEERNLGIIVNIYSDIYLLTSKLNKEKFYFKKCGTSFNSHISSNPKEKILEYRELFLNNEITILKR